nr:ankyrin repeat domain-containing protein [uncultured Amphritea sp.]
MRKSIAVMATSLCLLLTGCAIQPPYYTFEQTYFWNVPNNLERVKQFVTRGDDVNKLYDWGTPLCGAAGSGNVVVMKYLLANGAQVNKGNLQGNESRSPLHSAAAHGSYNAAKLLLIHGADTDLLNRKNQTPLMLAEDEPYWDVDYEPVIQLLKETSQAKPAWDEALNTNTVSAYTQFIYQYPDSIFIQKAQEKLDSAQREQQKHQEMAALEASIPVPVRRDKYMVALVSALKQQHYQKALEIFPKLEALPLPKDPSLNFFYGEALLKTDQPTQALKKLYQYISEQGKGAKHYSKALELINQAESQL